MQALLRLLSILLVRVPLEVLVALIRSIQILVLVLPILVLRFLECLLKALREKTLYPEDIRMPCGRLPEAVIRRPDPAIYSQNLVQSLGLPVTWNNPDIWVAPAANPGAIEPDSYHLVENTDYIVSVRVHNASIDPAIGVRVRLNYRPWSFNSPQLVPVETDASGNEVFHFVNTGPMPAAAIAQFRWHTPSLSPGEVGQHFCLQASLFHPLDVNAANNMGQENTNVWQTTVRAGQEVPLDIPLFNYARRQQRFRFEAYEYAIEEARVELTLKTMRGYRRMSPSTFLASLLPSFHFGFSRALDGGLNRSPFPRLHMRFQPRLVAVKNKYVGLQRIQETMRSRTNRLPQEITITAEGEDLRRGIELQPKTLRTLLFRITVAPTIQPKVLPLTILARSEDGVLAGGVTIVLQIEE